jgi:hypothetical protein
MLKHRTTVNIPLIQAIETYVSKRMDPGRAKKVVNNCKALDQARREISNLKHSEDAVQYRKLLIFYFNGLRYLDSKFKFKYGDVDAVNLSFTWRDSCSGQEYISTDGLELEMNSILFNLGAVMNNIASTTPITIDNIKYVSMDFQSSAWFFDHLWTTLETLPSEFRGIDFRGDNLKRLIALELGQSQFLFFKKAELSGMKPGLISKLIRQTWIYFTEAEGYVTGTLKLEYEKYCPYLIKLTSVYTHSYNAVSHLYKAKELHALVKKSGNGVGTALGHWTVASRILSSLKTVNEVVQQNIQKRLEEAEALRSLLIDLNQSVYNEPAVSEDSLPKLESKNFAILRSMENEISENFSKRQFFEEEEKRLVWLKFHF